MRRLLTYAAAVGALGAVLQVPIAAVYGQGLALGDVVTGFDPGSVVNEMVSAASCWWASASPCAPARGRRRTARAACSWAGALVALLAPSLVGPLAAFDPSPLLVVADVLHVTAGAVWLGGLVGPRAQPACPVGSRGAGRPDAGQLLHLAGGVLVAVALTGSFLAWRIVGSWAGLVATTYGWLLLVKIAIALVAAGIGGWNRWRVLPAVRAAAGFGDRERAAAAVTRTVRVEAVLLVALLGVTGFLVNQSPRPVPITVASGTTGVGAATAGDLSVLAVMDPQRTGNNTLLVQVQDAAGEPYDPPTTPVVALSTDGLDVGEVTVTPIGAGTYRGQVVVPRAGEWEVQVSIELSRFDNPVTTVRLTVRP